MVEARRLFDYVHKIRHSYLEALARLSWDEVVKNREASFYSLKGVFLHMLEVEDRLLNFIIPEKPELWREYNHEDFKDIESIRRRMDDVESRALRSLGDLKPEDMKKTVPFKTRSGDIFNVSVEDMLIQAFTEELQHRGELIALLWQMGIEPPPMQWYRYVVENPE